MQAKLFCWIVSSLGFNLFSVNRIRTLRNNSGNDKTLSFGLIISKYVKDIISQVLAFLQRC